MILFLVKFTLGALTITFCVSILSALTYYWLQIIQGFCEGFFNSTSDLKHEDYLDWEDIIPDIVTFNENGDIIEQAILDKDE